MTSEPAAPATPIFGTTAAAWPIEAGREPAWAAAAALARFAGKPGQALLVPGPEGALDRVMVGLDANRGPSVADLRRLAAQLPSGDYCLAAPFDATFADDRGLARAALAWSQGAYRFAGAPRRDDGASARLRITSQVERTVDPIRRAFALARDLINTPANRLGPAELESTAREVAGRHGAAITAIQGADLLPAGYPAVYAVGAAAAAGREPRMIELTWGRADDPLLALIGKGVTFDSGGLDIKPTGAMRLMKKDMGGAAHALALADMVMAADLPVRLLLLLPVVENAISGAAMRPGDVIDSRKGLSIEIGNTDAEGRLILADALARAAESKPDLTIDLATLTGAARIALGPEVVPFYTTDESLAGGLAAASAVEEDPLWRMPLWSPYAAAIDSDVADIRNDADPWAQAGSITAALFLQRFAPAGAWAHFDIFGWNPRSRPGWPAGAEAQALAAIFAVLRERYR